MCVAAAKCAGGRQWAQAQVPWPCAACDRSGDIPADRATGLPILLLRAADQRSRGPTCWGKNCTRDAVDRS